MSAATSWRSNYHCLGQGLRRERILHFPFLWRLWLEGTRVLYRTELLRNWHCKSFLHYLREGGCLRMVANVVEWKTNTHNPSLTPYWRSCKSGRKSHNDIPVIKKELGWYAVGQYQLTGEPRNSLRARLRARLCVHISKLGKGIEFTNNLRTISQAKSEVEWQGSRPH